MSSQWSKDIKVMLEDSKGMQILEKAGMAWNTKIKPKDVLIHTTNRGGHLVNPYDVVSKGQSHMLVTKRMPYFQQTSS